MKHYLADLDRRLNRIMAAVPLGEAGRKLRKRIAANRAHLLVFITNRDVPYTNNVSDRHVRPSVIFRKVTNGFRSEWGAETYAAFRSLASTAKANRASVLDVLRFVLPQTFPSSHRPDRSEQLRFSTLVHMLQCKFLATGAEYQILARCNFISRLLNSRPIVIVSDQEYL